MQIIMLERDIIKQLTEWKISKRRKPLIVKGARQVGKTFVILEFAKKFYKNHVYLNFDENPELCQFFVGNIQPQRILRDLSIYFDQVISPLKTLIFLDEIQECPDALNSLKYFNELANEYHIVSAGSLLGIKLRNTKGFPVGKVNFLDMYPMNFLEFLTAIGKTQLREMIESKNNFMPIALPLHQNLIQLLKYYLFVGGMPEAVAQYCENNIDLQAVKIIHKEILDAYLLDFAKHAVPNQVMKITTVWEMVPVQLCRENKKFIFSAISKSARAREYETAIQWLVDAGLIHKSYCISAPKLPLEAYCDKNAFKVFHLDVGLLGSMVKIDPRVILESYRLFTEFKGALTENYVAQQLVSHSQNQLYYWTSSGIAEVDFVVPNAMQPLPLEVKAGISKQKKSLISYNDKYQPPILLKTTTRNYLANGKVINVPLYAISQIASGKFK